MKYLPALPIFLGCAIAAPLQRVAYDDAGADGKQPHHLESSGSYRFPNPGTHDEVLRSCAFGPSVSFGYAKLNPKAKYKAKLRFFSDAPRQLRVKANETVVLPSVALANGKVLEIETALPSTDPLLLEFECISGSGAVISDIEILSTDPTPLGVIPPPPVALPRLSPRPDSVAGCAQPSMDLGGTWKFITKAPADLATTRMENIADWRDIQVPGEWVMQGFKVAYRPLGDFPCGTGDAAAYARSFTVPADWQGKRVKLRCDSVYSDCVIYLNGREAGRHVGCFIPFELDVTALVKPGADNFITMSVTNESPADKLSNGSRYACHQLGGINRKITLFALPATHVSRLHVATVFDREYRNANLELDVEIEGGSADLLVSLKQDRSDRSDLTDHRISPGHACIAVANPAKWDNEHPNVHTLTIKLEQAGKLMETITQKVGFRQVEVRGNQLFVNNTPVKLRGVCRHEVHPLTGRADTAKLGRRDAEIFRDANCNYIRTSHYPPTGEFLDACDELGLFVECEAPFCWAQMTNLTPAQIPDLMTRQELEMLEAYRNHPSITHWSLGNESKRWADYFLPAARLFKRLDPTRPINFSAWEPHEDGNFCDIANNHYPGVCGPQYPGLQGPARFADSARPIVFDEYCHLNSYNRRELATDPGLRDLWGLGLAAMWEKIRTSQGCLGGAIWSGIDDTFFLPGGDTVGYGTWGPIDGWRRPKPEYWHMKKSYSPLRIAGRAVPANQPLKLTVENRHEFTNLSELHFEWRCGGKSGTAKTAAAPGHSATLEIPVSGDGKLLGLRAISPRGFVIDEWEIALGSDPRTALPAPAAKPGKASLTKKNGLHQIQTPSGTIVLDAVTGRVTAPFAGPDLMLLPCSGDNCGGVQMIGKETDAPLFSDTCRKWKAQAVEVRETPSGITATVSGEYDEAKGTYTYTIGNDGAFTVAYDFAVKQKCDPRQLGVVFRLPSECQSLSWRRNAQWSVYPEDHIGRPSGTASAFVKDIALSGLAGPRTQPSASWRSNANKHGSNDFRSTKMNIFEAALFSSAGHGLRVLSDGSQHARSWMEGATANLLVADYTNHGSPAFFNEHVIPYRHLKPGDRISGKAQLEILSDDPALLTALPLPGTGLVQLTPRPAAVAGVKSPLLDLNGAWEFSAADNSDFKPIRVPGEWVMQGFSVESGKFATYRRTFDLPADWTDKAIKLRFDAVHAVCKVSLNGKDIGGHEGGFVPFELDATAAIKPGTNELIVKVQSESVADSISCVSQYAAHQVGGILRKVTLFCVPAGFHVNEIHYETALDGSTARLNIHTGIVNLIGTRPPGSHRLLDASGREIAKGMESNGTCVISIPDARLWTSETPYLYTLETQVGEETLRQRIGLREISIEGNRFLINGKPVKLLGVCRHEVHPLRGRSLTPELCRKDAELYREANVNLVRTSHYPPSEEFLTACDELGIFVECEAAICWINHHASPVWKTWNHLDRKYLPYFLRANLDNVAANRNHPSIIMWSLANESWWSPWFAEVLDVVKNADPTRPAVFHDQCWGGGNNEGSKADIANYHYPTEQNPAAWSEPPRPVWFGEYAHVQCYNRRELVTDPGIRADWGRPLARMVDLIWQQPGCLGGAVWSGIDDVFQMPNGDHKGYGHWGPIDGWRRIKPEYHGMRAAYTPVRFVAADTPAGGPLVLTIQNRFNFTDLAAIKLSWQCGGETGIIQLNLPPHATGKTTIASKSWQPGAILEITAATSDGRMVGSAHYAHPDAQALPSGGDSLRVSDGRLVGKDLAIDPPMPMVLPLNGEGGAPTAAGTQLSKDIAPFTPLPENWKPDLTTNGDGVTTATGETDDVKARITFTPVAKSNRLRVDYELTLKKDINPRQWGLVFTLPPNFDALIWNRKVDGDWIDDTRLDRRNGQSLPDLQLGPSDPGVPGSRWLHDAHPMGCADFRSTRTRITRAVLADAKHHNGLQVLSPDASQAIRAWVDGKQIRLLVAGFNTGGCDSFFSPHYAAERRPLEKGGIIRSSFVISTVTSP